MTIKFDKTEQFNNAKAALVQAMKDGDDNSQAKALEGFFDALRDDVSASASKQANEMMMDRSIMQSRGQNVLTSEETRFFNQVIDRGGFDDESILPVTTQERIFEDLTTAHPLLQQLGIQNLGAVTEFIYADPSGAAVWGPLFGDIKGQLDTAFRKESIQQLKLTAFIPLSNDMLALGPVWIERYVRTLLVEAISVGLERGFVEGNGVNMPVGLLYEVNPDTNAVTAKTPAGTLTFEGGQTTINELQGVVETLSRYRRPGDSADRIRNVAGRVVMVVNPFDNFGIQARATVRNDAGTYVTSLPFNPTIVESEFIPQGQALFFVRGQYIAAVAGGYQLKKFDQTLAMDDATLYIAKQFATGKPADNYAAQLYTLDLTPADATPTV